MLRTTTSQAYQKRKTNQTILRSRRKIPQYSDTLNNSLHGYIDDNNNNSNNRYGDFNVLNETNHPGIVYYFIEIRNSAVNNNRNDHERNNGNNNNNNNNNSNSSDSNSLYT